MPDKNEHKHGFVRIDAAASESTYPFNLPYIVTAEVVDIDTVYVPLDTLASAVDETFSNCRPLLRIAAFTLKELKASKMYFQHLRATYDAVPVRKGLAVLDSFAKYERGTRPGHYAKQLASRLRASAFLSYIKTVLEQRAAGTTNMALGCISKNIFYQGHSFKPVQTPGWELPFKVSEKYKNNPIQPKPYVESCAPLPPVRSSPSSNGKKRTPKRKDAPKKAMRPFDNLVLSSSCDKSVEAWQRGERNARRMRKVLNRKRAA